MDDLQKIKGLFEEQIEWYDSKKNFEECDESFLYDECPEAFAVVKRGTWLTFLEILSNE